MKTQKTKETTTQKTAAKKPAAKKPAAKKAPKGVELATIEVRNLPQLQGWKDKLTALVKQNPVIEVTDKESYEDAKKRRLAIRNGRYEVQNQDKELAKVISNLRTQAAEVAAELIEIVLPTENSQHEKIKAWETKEAARLEKKRLEEEDRKNKIKDRINAIYTDFKDQLKETTFETISGIKGTLETLETLDREEFSEFEAEYLETVDRLRDQMEERIEELYASETQRKAAIAAQEAADAAKKEAAIANRNSQRMQKLAPVFSYGPAVDMGKVFEMTDTSFEEFLHTKRDSKTQADKLAKEQTDQLAEYKRKQEEAAEKALKEIEVTDPETVGKEPEQFKTFDELTVEEMGVDEEDDLTPVEKHFEQLEEVALAPAVKRLTQDQNRLLIFINSINPYSPVSELKSEAATSYHEEILEELAAFKKRLLTGLEKL